MEMNNKKFLNNKVWIEEAEDRANVIISYNDLDGKFLKVTSGLLRMLGYTKKELLAMKFRDVTHPDDVESNLEKHRKLINQEIPTFDIVKRYITKKKEMLWVSISCVLVKSEMGRAVNLSSIYRRKR